MFRDVAGSDEQELPKELQDIRRAFKSAVQVPEDYKNRENLTSATKEHLESGGERVYFARLRGLVDEITKFRKERLKSAALLGENRFGGTVPRFVIVEINKTIDETEGSPRLFFDTPVVFDTETVGFFQLKDGSDTSEKALRKTRTDPNATLRLDERVLDFPEIPKSIIRASFRPVIAEQIVSD